MKVTSIEKSEIRESLSPEIQSIPNEELRRKVVSAWAMALEQSNFASLKDFGQFKATMGVSAAEHMRGVTSIATGIAKGIESIFPDFPVNMDTVAAGALCHDLGKPFEYDPDNKKNWEKNKWTTGNPGIRHPVYGAHIALNADLPPEIVHIVGAHSMEGAYLQRSIEAAIVHYADEAFWDVVCRGKLGKSLFQITGGISKKERH